MRRLGCALVLLCLLAAGAVWADETPQAVTVNVSAAAREVREFKVDAAIKGKIPLGGTKAEDLEATFGYKIRHRYMRREGDGELPMEVSLMEGEFVTAGQKLTITPGLYPKLTVLFDKDWKITDVFGMTDAQLAQALPGINYSNLIMLFYLPEGNKPHAVGDKWESTLKLVSYGDTYRILTTLKGVETIGGVSAAVVRQEIERLPRPDVPQTTTMKAIADTAFAIDNGRLLKSHVECQVASKPEAKDKPAQSGQDPPPLSANIKIDIVPGG